MLLPGLRLAPAEPAEPMVVVAMPIPVEATELVRLEPGCGCGWGGGPGGGPGGGGCGSALLGGGPGEGDVGDIVSGLTRSGISSGSS